MIHLETLRVCEFNERDLAHFPFSLEVIRSLRGLHFASPVNFFGGENGSGKSTVLESLACAINSITVGSESVRTDRSLAAVRKLAQYYRLGWRRRTHKGFFLRAEDFFGYAKKMRQIQEDLLPEMTAVHTDYARRSHQPADLAPLPDQHQLSAIAPP